MARIGVVGGGPVGVVTSLALARRGHDVTVFERHVEIYDLPRAITIDDEGQRILGDLGLDAELDAITTPLPGAEFVSVDGARIVGHDIAPGAVSPLGYPPSVLYYQPELEAMLRRAATDAGVDLHLGATVTSVTQTGLSVQVGVSDTAAGAAQVSGGHPVSHEFDWLVAADGASSPVRKSLGIEFVDQGFDQDWLVVDVRMRRNVASLPRLVQQICDPARPTTYVVGHPPYKRWEFQLQPGESAEDMARPERVWELLGPWITPDDAALIRGVVYRFHATVAERMRDGRVLLAGDAAHQMPPFLGQGLCSGLRDAHNLAWKLTMVTSGLAADAFLDTYDSERGPHAAGLVAHAVDTGRLIDQLAGRGEHADSVEAGYGGGRSFPHLTGGMIHGDRPAGRQCPRTHPNAAPLREVCLLYTSPSPRDS